MDTEVQKRVVFGLFRWYIQMKSFHFMTKIYNRHYNVDQYLDAYSKLYDKLVEVCMGHHGQIHLGDYQLTIENIDDGNVLDHVARFQEFLSSLKVVYAENSDILNIRDEIEAETAKLVYLLRLN